MTATAILRDLVRVPSLSHHEAQAAAHVEALGRAGGLRVWRDDDNVVLELGEGDDVLLLNSHLDVVPPSEAMPHGAFDAHETAEPGAGEDGGAGPVMWGRGTVDAKASGAAMLAAMLSMRAAGFAPTDGRVILALTACEETGGGYNGMHALRPRLPTIAGAIVGEPTEMQPCLAQKGLLILRLDAHGRTAHAARAHLGDNAIARMARAIGAVERIVFDRVDPYLGRATATVTTIEGGSAKNVVPDRCTAVVDIRIVPAYAPAEVVEIVRAAIADAAVDVIVHSDRLVPVSTDPGSRIARAVAAAHPGGVPFGSPTASDWVFLADVPTVKMGPGPSERSHTPDERIELWKVEHAARVYEATARAFFGA